MNEKGSPLILIVCVLIMAGVCGGLFYLRNMGKDVAEVKPAVGKIVAKSVTQSNEPTGDGDKVRTPVAFPREVIEEPSFGSAAEIVQNFEYGLERISSSKDLEVLLGKMGISGISEDQLNKLYEKIGKNGANLKRGNVVDEIGELKRKEHSRWALNLEDGSRIFFDLKKGEDGKWLIEKFHDVLEGESALDAILEKGNVAQMDALLVAHSFVQFALRQEFPKAKQLVKAGVMSDVKLAGLCIIFEEGNYRLREPRGVLKNFNKDIVSGYLVNIVSDDKRPSNFSLLLKRADALQPWRVAEMNFSLLLEQYIKANEGESYYSPFVKNPKGGDSIVVYFAFDTNQLSPRTQRQLRIVANILKLDDKKKMTLTGHTDAKGGQEYNKMLSTKRAIAVRDFLVSEGVGKHQITTIGFGAHRPRVANTNVDGTDNPEGRKANRRTEIYLDF